MLTKEECIKRLKEARYTIQPYYYINEAIDYAIKELQNPPLKLEELKEETWVWDSEYNEWCYIDFIAGEYIHRKYIDDCIAGGEFEENRFYRREVNNDED